MNAVPHFGFIVAAYGATVAVLGATVVLLVRDRRIQTRLLARFERSGTAADRP